ncbi:MAG: hypothetical protein WCG27_11835, partial [Pseudomonadota bacterium]
DMRYRQADAYLLSLVYPSPLAQLTLKDQEIILGIVKKLQRPAGILRYENDSYQSGNYWISDPSHFSEEQSSLPTLTGDASTPEGHQERLKNFIPQTEAQWFFDSFLCLSHLKIGQISDQNDQRMAHRHQAVIYFKRALGQITGEFDSVPLIAADGSTVSPFLLPESINILILEGKKYFLPSPILPLNWAKAKMMLAIHELEKAFQQ